LAAGKLWGVAGGSAEPWQGGADASAVGVGTPNNDATERRGSLGAIHR
jgi:hypothetical protein